MAFNIQPSESIFATVGKIALHNAIELLRDWLPGGRFHGDEYVALNPKRADEGLGSFKVNIKSGLWADFAIGVAGFDLISLYAYLNDIRQIEAARLLADRLGVDQ